MLQSPHLVSASNAKGKSHLFITPPVHVMLITISCRLTTPVVKFSAILRCQCLGQVRLPIFKKKNMIKQVSCKRTSHKLFVV